MNAPHPEPQHHVVLRRGLPPPEYNFLKLYSKQLQDEVTKECLLIFRCRTFEIGPAFAKLDAIDPEDAEITNTLWIPVNFILTVSENSPDKPKFGFAED
jgi:hypothetical protein